MDTHGGHEVDVIRSLGDLLDLQEVDLDIDRLLEERSTLPELDAYKAAHEEVQRIEREKAEADEAQTAADRGLHKSNGELEILADKAAAEQNRLYAGGMSARDADYLRREVEMLYAKVSSMEDEVLHFIEKKEECEALVAKLAEELASTTEERDELRTVITEKWRVIDKHLAVKEERKGAIIPLVEPDLLALYEDLRESRGGRVVGRLIDGVCGVCNLQMSAAEVASALKGDPPRCIHCRAILVS